MTNVSGRQINHCQYLKKNISCKHKSDTVTMKFTSNWCMKMYYMSKYLVFYTQSTITVISGQCIIWTYSTKSLRMRQWEWINNSFFSTYSSIVKTAMEGTEAVLCTVTWKYWISSKHKCTPFKWTVSSLAKKIVYIYITLCSLNFQIYSNE